MKFIRLLVSLLPAQIAHAHCDVPCGIYDPKPAQIAAATILKMVEKIEAVPQDNDVQHANSFARMVWTKEEHARKCKEELLILWTDYFKQEHVDMFPKLHEIFWKAAKLCSKNKQEVNKKAAEELVKAVEEIADMFHKSKSTSSASVAK